jgi:phytoene dehydrogenase-like protein
MFDVIVVGSGHNGMISAAYLARAGLKVCVFERQRVCGGAVQTRDDLIEGYKIDVGSSAHIMIHQTPVIRELELEKHGLEYIEMAPWAFAPELDATAGKPTGRAIHFYKDVDKTCHSIAAFSDRDAEAYRRFVEAWGPLNEGVFEAFLRTPTPFNLVRGMMGRSLKGSDRTNMVRKLMAPYGQLVTETFENETLRTAMIWLAAQSGPPPSEPATGDFAGWQSMYHQSGMKRAKGGSGALTQALKRRIEADGGQVIEEAAVERIETDATGRVRGIRLASGEKHDARAVVAACHIQTTINRLLAEAPLEKELRERVSSLRVGNGFGMIVRCAMSGLPEYPGQAANAAGVSEAHHGLQLLCPSRKALDRAYSDYLAGRPPEEPLPLAMTFSALDDSLAPRGRHTLFVWGQYHPYELAAGGDWDTIAEREADKLLAAVDRFAPGTSGKVLDRFIQTPKQIAEMHGLLRANVMHLEMSIDQMFTFRPTPELSEYRVPGLKGMYLTGASTHPGGGVWGASGYNAAKVILKERRKWR